MSYLTEINEYLAQTRDMSESQLNQLINELDSQSHCVDSQALAHTVLGYMMSAKIKGELPHFAQAVVRATNLKAQQMWLFAEPSSKTSTAPAAEQDTKPAKNSKQNPTLSVNKMVIAREIYSGLVDKTKPNVIKIFVEKLSTTPAGAQTYYYACGGKKTNVHPKVIQTASAITAYKAATPTKRELARRLFNNSVTKDRETIVSKFVTELGLTKACATTYYYSCGGAPVRRGLKALAKK